MVRGCRRHQAAGQRIALKISRNGQFTTYRPDSLGAFDHQGSKAGPEERACQYQQAFELLM